MHLTTRTRLILMLPALLLAIGLGAYRYQVNLNGCAPISRRPSTAAMS